ncbi:hypothetical protein ACI3QN_12875, partial [Propionibacterium freudenreichii]
LIQLLRQQNVDFVIIGGFAGVLYGSTLVTRDLDICALLTSENIEKLRNILRPFNPRHRMTPQKLSFLTEPREISSIKNLYLDTDLG